MTEDLRRIDRIDVCCRVVVRDRHGLWTAVTEDVCSRGVRIVTNRLLRPGTRVKITLSSDLFPEDLEAEGEAVWSTGDRLGIRFLRPEPDGSGISPREWIRRVIEHGTAPGTSSTIVPVVSRSGVRPPRVRPSRSAASGAIRLRHRRD